MKVAVIGAGISGVSLACLLSLGKKDGMDLDVTVFEQSDRSGGCIKTLERDGFLVESGPNGVLNNKVHVKQIIQDAGSGSAVLLSSDLTRRRYIQFRKRLHLAPTGPISAISSGLLSFPGKLRVLCEPFIAPKTESIDESIASFATRRIGKEAAGRLVATLVGGVYAGDYEKLSMQSSFPRLCDLERRYGSLVKGMIRKMKEAKNQPGSGRAVKRRDGFKLISTAGGMQGFVSMFESAAKGVKFRYSTKVRSITGTGSGGYALDIVGGEEIFDVVVLCCNARDGAGLVGSLAPDLSKKFAEMVFAPVFVCGMGFDEKEIAHPMDGFGYLVAPEEGSMVLGCLFSSSLFAGRAPAGKRLITVIAVGDKNRQYMGKSDRELEQIAFDSVQKILGVKKLPEMTASFRTEYALPQYYIGHSAVISAAEQAMQANPGIYIGGNTLHGVSVADCIAESQNIAEKILR